MYENYRNSIDLNIIQWVNFFFLSVDNKFDIENCKKLIQKKSKFETIKTFYICFS